MSDDHTKTIVSTSNAPVAIGPYSHAVKASGFIFTSGQLPIDPKVGKIVSDDIGEQTRQVLHNLKSVLEAGGSGLNNVVKTTVLLSDINDFKAMNDVYAEFFMTDCPARSAFQVASLPIGAKVEIESIAALNEKD